MRILCTPFPHTSPTTRSYELKFKVDPEYHPLVIGKGGAVIMKIRTDFGVQINLPKRGEAEDDTITIQGYEEKAHQAKDAIMAIVQQHVSVFFYIVCYFYNGPCWIR